MEEMQKTSLVYMLQVNYEVLMQAEKKLAR